MKQLPDRELERQLHTNIEYMYFCDMTTTDRVPDHSTICRFRGELVKRGLLRPLLEEVNHQSEEAGLKPGPGRDSILDAAPTVYKMETTETGKNNERFHICSRVAGRMSRRLSVPALSARMAEFSRFCRQRSA